MLPRYKQIEGVLQQKSVLQKRVTGRAAHIRAVGRSKKYKVRHTQALQGQFRHRSTSFTLLGLLLLIMLLSPARADVGVAPWDANASRIESAYSAIPTAFKIAGDQITVQSASPKDFEHARRTVYPDEAREFMDGLYLPTRENQTDHPKLPLLPMILLNETMEDERFNEVFRHEYGHHVWWHLLKNDERAAFGILWTDKRSADKLPSPYARKNKGEGFAEVFKFYLARPEALDRDLRAFIDRVKARLTKR